MALSKEEILEAIAEMSVIDVVELIEAMEEKFGVTAAAPVAVAGGAAPAAEAAEEKTEFDVELTSVGEKKINVIKVIRGITALGLKEAKEIADSAPSVVKEAAAKEEAEEIKKKLEDAGATVTLK